MFLFRRRVKMLDKNRKLTLRERGATAAEYAMVIGVVAVALVIALVAFKDKISGWITKTDGVVSGEIKK